MAAKLTIALVGSLALLPICILGQDRPASSDVVQYVVPKGMGQKFSEKIEDVEVKLSSAQTDGRFTLQDEIWHPGFDVKPHYHREHAETFYVISGQIEWNLSGKTSVLSAGDIVFIPPKTVHSVHVVGATDAHIIFISQPGGFEHLEEKRQSYNEAQKQDPAVKAALREFGDAVYPDAR